MSEPDNMNATPMATPGGVAIGVDVGNARVGLAISDPEGRIAIPLRTLKRDAKKNFDIRQLGLEIQERAVLRAYVGLPLTMSGGESDSTRMARDYAQLLAEHLAEKFSECTVHLIDERLSSVTARRQLAGAGVSSKNFKESVDQLAATEILQHALDFQQRLHRAAGTPIFPAAGAGDPHQQKDGSDEQAQATRGGHLND